MNNGVCPIHLLYQGQQLEENLFAAFVRALFSFSKDMSSGEQSISSMSFGDMEIHYLAHPEEKFFVAIATDQGINVDVPNKYLNYISNMFATNYFDYIEKLPPFEPTSFKFFLEAIDIYIKFYESKYQNSLEGIEEIKIDPIDTLQQSTNFFVVYNKERINLNLFENDSMDLVGSYYPGKGKITYFSLQKNSKFIAYANEVKTMYIKPIPIINNSQIHSSSFKIETEISWIASHPSDTFVFVGNSVEIFKFDIMSEEKICIKSEIPISKCYIHSTNKIFILDEENKLYYGNLPEKETVLSKANMSLVLEEKVNEVYYGPKDLLIIECFNESIYFWNVVGEKIRLKDRFPNPNDITFNEERNLIFIITKFNEFLIYELDGSQLVNYNLTEDAVGACVNEKNKLDIIYYQGLIKHFPATINRKEIAQLRSYLTKRVDSVDSHILRIHKGFQQILSNLERNRSSTKIKHDLNQLRVYKQQIKRLIDKNLLERTSIMRDLYFRLMGYQNQVQRVIVLITELQEKLEQNLKESKEAELSGKTPTERIEDYIAMMKPRQSIGIGSLADDLQLPYEDVLSFIQKMDQRGLLSGFLTRGSSASIKDSVVFVKKDPKFEDSGITSF